MDASVQAIQTLLTETRTASLATQGKHGPEASMTPFALHGEQILLHTSTLARHTANMRQHPQVGLLICTAERPGESPLALPRLTLQGHVETIEAGGVEAAKAAYLHHIPEAEMLFSFADFQLFQLRPCKIHWVGGFGKARFISSQQWQHITAS